MSARGEHKSTSEMHQELLSLNFVLVCCVAQVAEIGSYWLLCNFFNFDLSTTHLMHSNLACVTITLNIKNMTIKIFDMVAGFLPLSSLRACGKPGSGRKPAIKSSETLMLPYPRCLESGITTFDFWS